MAADIDQILLFAVYASRSENTEKEWRENPACLNEQAWPKKGFITCHNKKSSFSLGKDVIPYGFDGFSLHSGS